MGFMDKLKKTAGVDNEFDEFDSNDGYYDDFENPNGYEDDKAIDNAQTETQVYSPVNAQNSYGTARASSYSVSGSSLEMKVVRPEQFDSVTQIADHLLEHRTVVLNLENTNKETARRLIDFLSGVAYSIDGALKKIATNAYIITPSNVDVGDASLKNSQKAARKEAEAAPAAPTAMPDEFGDF